MSRPSRGDLEAALANAIIRFEKDQLGRGPVETRAYLVDDLAVVRGRGVLTAEEVALVPTPHGRSLIREMRHELIDCGRQRLEAVVQQATGSRVIGVLSDIDHVRYDYQYPRLPVDASHERYAVDHNRCVLCQRCVRVCAQVEGAHTWDVMGRGTTSHVITDLAMPWGESLSCTSCGKCVQVCPTGALFEHGHAVAEMHKRRDFVPALLVQRSVTE